MRDGDDALDVTKRDGVKTTHPEKNVACDDELTLRPLPDGERRQRIVARHMSMSDLYLVFAHEPRQLQGAAEVERVAKRQAEDVRGGQGI